jgi:integrase
MSRDELALLLELLPDRWRLFFWFLAATGLRISEAIALQWRHIEFAGSTPHVKVRRALVKGRMEPPKSRYGRRDVPLDHALVAALGELGSESDGAAPDDLVFAAMNGSPLMPNNVRRRVL